MLLTQQALLDIFTPELIANSTYTTRKGNYIRLTNSKPEEASVQALYPHTTHYTTHLRSFENVKANKIDYKDGIPLANRTTDLYLDYISATYNDIPLPPLVNSDKDA